MSNRLPILAADAARALAEMEAATRTASERALDAGRALLEAKGLCAHGEWLPWLKQAGIAERRAQRCMTLAASNLNSDTVTDLGGVMPALRFLRLRKIGVQLLDDVEACNLLDPDGDESLVALEAAIMVMNRMIAMFPPVDSGRSVQ